MSRHFWKMEDKRLISTWKDVQLHQPSETCKWKQHWDFISSWSEKQQEQWCWWEREPEGTLYTLLVGMSVSLANVEIPPKVNLYPPTAAQRQHPWYSPKRLSQRHHTPVFTGAPYTTRKLRCMGNQVSGEQMENVWFICTVSFSPALTENEVCLKEEVWDARQAYEVN